MNFKTALVATALTLAIAAPASASVTFSDGAPNSEPAGYTDISSSLFSSNGDTLTINAPSDDGFASLWVSFNKGSPVTVMATLADGTTASSPFSYNGTTNFSVIDSDSNNLITEVTFTFSSGDFMLKKGPATTPFLSLPKVNGAGAVPEPAAWSMMLLGFGGLGAVLRSRRHRMVAA